MIGISLSIPNTGSSWEVRKQVTGPRGGKSWRKIISQPATGGTYVTTLEPGTYKEVYYVNSFPRSRTFEVK